MAQEVSNETTRIATLKAQAKEAGLIDDTSPRFNDADELFAYLEED